MKVEINLRAYPGDEVWLALDGGPYKATVESVTTYISHIRDVAVYEGCRYTRYSVLREDGRRTDAYNIAIFHTKEEAQKRLEEFNKLGLYTKEFSEAVLCELKKNPDVVLIDEKQDYKGFVSLVKQMREARHRYSALSREFCSKGVKPRQSQEWQDARKLTKQLENEVDEYLKKIKE